jgi:aspartyl-tRNA synthetase
MVETVLAEAEELASLAGEKAGPEEPLYTVTPSANRTRPGTEEKRSDLSRTGQLLKSAPAVKGSYFKVASILE